MTIDPVGTSSTSRRPGFTDDGRPLRYMTVPFEIAPEKSKLNNIDLLRLALRNPKKLLNLPYILDRRRAYEFIHQKFAYCPLFYFDDTLTIHAHHLKTKYSDVLLRLMSDIRLPFPVMIITYNGKVHYGLDELHVSLLWESGVKIRIQSLAIGDGVHFFYPFSHSIEPSPSAGSRVLTSVEIGYGGAMRAQAHGEWTFPEERLVSLAVGAHLTGMVGPEHRDTLAETFNQFMPYLQIMQPVGGLDPEIPTDALGKLLLNTSGQAAQIAAFLVLLNLRDYVTRITEEPAKPGRYRYKGVTAPYMTTRVVTLTIPEPKVIKALQKRASEVIRARQRRHSVRGHWMIRTRRPSCIHLFTKIDEDRMRCSRCDGLRRWRRAHERGDASLGYVRHEEYKVEHADHQHR